MILVWEIIIGWLTLLGIVRFILMGIDETGAQTAHGHPETVFFRLALAGGAAKVIPAEA